jgi:predicted ester cyclase
MLESGKMREFAKAYTAAWCSQVAASVAAHFSTNGSLTINQGAPAIGRVVIAEAAQSFMTAFPDLQVVMDDIVVDGQLAEYHWTLTGTNTGPGGTGQRVRIRGFEEWRVGEDGLIAESRGHFDAEEYQRQLEQGTPRQVRGGR